MCFPEQVTVAQYVSHIMQHNSTASAQVPLLMMLYTILMELIISVDDNTDQTHLASPFHGVKVLMQGPLNGTYEEENSFGITISTISAIEILLFLVILYLKIIISTDHF